MILDLVKTLQSAAIGMMDGSVLGPKEGYEQASSLTFGIALTTLAEALDGAAECYCEENAALRALFGDAAGCVSDTSLAARVAAAAGEGDPGLKVSALRETNETLRRLLIELHEYVEQSEDDAARDLEKRIWHELARSTERRRIPLGPF